MRAWADGTDAGGAALVEDATAALRTGRSELDRMFATAPAGEIPRGFAKGTALVATGTPFSHVLAQLVRPFWLGKHFDSRQSRLRNVITPARLGAFVARVYEAPSRLDGRPAIILDYSKTSLLVKPVRDELRQVGPRDYLGIVLVAGRRVPVDFWLHVDDDSLGATTHDVAEFELEQRTREWLDTAPVRVDRTVHLPAAPDAVFSVLADIARWSDWFGGMRRVEVDGPASGVGALRTVWAGGSRVQERFSRWDEGQGLTFSIVRCSRPGLRAMAEDWSVSPEGPGTRLDIRIGVEPARGIPAALTRAVVARATRGATGIASAKFPTG